MTNPPRDADNDDLRAVMAEEMHRGRRRGVVDTAARQRRARQVRGFLDLVEAGATDDEVAEAATALLGREPHTAELGQILRRCRQYRRAR